MKAREIKGRMRGLEQTLAITQAMQTVAAAKIAPSQTKYALAQKYRDGLTDFCKKAGVKNHFTEKRECKKVLLLVVSSDRGLCGGYNSGVKAAFSKIDFQSIAKVCFLGKDVAIEADMPIAENVFFEEEKDLYKRAVRFGEFAFSEYQNKKCDSVSILAYDCQKSGMPTQKIVLPLSLENKIAKEYEIEIEKDEEITKQLLIAEIYLSLCSAAVVENVTRMAAMKMATSNGQEMLDDLAMEFNRVRQNEITSELNDSVNALRSKEI